MSGVDWQRVQDIFDQLLDTPADQRERRIATACGDDPEVERAVRELLEQDARTGALLDRAPATVMRRAVADEMAQRWIGRSVGAYRIVEKIGAGGMGQVFLAEREDQEFSKRVAIKVMSLVSAAALERFHRERQILANLEHPGIARLLDGGTTPDGLPYVVMELVDGVTFTEHCARLRLPLEARLRLFLEVCPRRPVRAPQPGGAPRPQAEQHPGDSRGRAEAARFRDRQAVV